MQCFFDLYFYSRIKFKSFPLFFKTRGFFYPYRNRSFLSERAFFFYLVVVSVSLLVCPPLPQKYELQSVIKPMAVFMLHYYVM